MLEGAIDGLALTDTPFPEPIECALVLTAPDTTERLPLNDALGTGLRIEFLGRISCVHCGGDTRRSYGGGYCYTCFTTLARCDLCVVSPDRCHYHLGTCREPEWADGFCMQPHIVYLANTSGIKVGITRLGRETGRWLDQGAVQALPILAAPTRRLAGLAEVRLALSTADRTDWQRLVRGEPEPADLAREAARLRREVSDGGPNALPSGLEWLDGERSRQFAYPVRAYPEQIVQLSAGGRGAGEGEIRGRLLGVKGQYLLLSNGVFNVRRHAGYHVRVELADAFAAEAGEQFPLF